MSRPPAAIHAEQLSLLPSGWVWPQQTDSLMAAIMLPFAEGLAEIEALAEQMLAELDPRTAIACISDYERLLGPDPCGRDTADMTLAERQQLAHMRWTARGGASIAYFTGIAARRGVAIAIHEVVTSTAERLCAGDELVEPPEQFVWTVDLDLTQIIAFEAGASEAGNKTFETVLSGIECDLMRLKPAHTDIAFHYKDRGHEED